MKRITILCFSILALFSLSSAQVEDSIAPSPIIAKDEMVFTSGLLVANALIGAEIEFCLNNRIGLVAGVGLVGAGAGINLHFYTTQSSDGFLNLDAKYMPAYQFIPAIEFGGRSFYGKMKKYGLSAEIGIGLHTTSGSLALGSKTYSWKPGQGILTYNIGFCINLGK